MSVAENPTILDQTFALIQIYIFHNHSIRGHDCTLYILLYFILTRLF